MEYLKFKKKGEKFEVADIDPVTLDAEIEKIDQALKLNETNTHALYKERAVLDKEFSRLLAIKSALENSVV